MQAIVQSTSKDYIYLPITQSHNKRYAEILNIQYIHTINPQPPDFCPAWGKIFTILDLFKTTKINEVLCLDGDAMVVDKTRNIFDFLSYKNYPGIDIHFESGRNPELIKDEDVGSGGELCHLNSGVFVIKKTTDSLDFLTSLTQCNIDIFKSHERNSYWEQSYMVKLFSENIDKYSKFIKVHFPNHVFNHYSDWIYHPCNGHEENWEVKRMDYLRKANDTLSKE